MPYNRLSLIVKMRIVLAASPMDFFQFALAQVLHRCEPIAFHMHTRERVHVTIEGHARCAAGAVVSRVALRTAHQSSRRSRVASVRPRVCLRVSRDAADLTRQVSACVRVCRRRMGG